MPATPSPRSYLPEHDLMFFGGVPAVYHCHHFNLFLDQTIDDAIGPQAGAALRFTAARAASHDLLAGLAARAGTSTPIERLALAQDTFARMGHGRLGVTADARGGEAIGEWLHYGFAWREKYGSVVRRTRPADAFAAGFAAAAVEVAFGLPRETMDAAEIECIATKGARCRFTLTPGAAPPAVPSVGEAEVRAQLRPSFPGREEQAIAKIAAGLRDFTAGVAGDAHGLVPAFGVLVTMHLAGYYNRICCDAVRQVEARAPQVVGAIETLLRESGHVCVFNTFGGILLSPEWEGLVGPPDSDPAQIVVGCLGIARALGFGHWTLGELAPGERLVVRTPSSYESVYSLARYGKLPRPNEYFLQGASLAIAQLAHRVDWKSRPQLTPEVYAALFQGGELPWKAEQTESSSCGHPRSEVVVTRVA